MGIQLTDNEYYTGLSNLALYVAMYSTNKTDKSRSLIDAFTTESLDYGDTKIFRSVPFPAVGDYSQTSSLLGNHTPEFTPTGEESPVRGIEEILRISNKKIIKNSYNTEMLKMAVKSEYGMSDFLAIVMGNIEAAKVDYLYDMVVNDLYSLTPADELTVTAVDTGEAAAPSEIQAAATLNLKAIELKIQYAIDKLTHFNTECNKYGLKQAVNLSDLRLVVFQPYQNDLVVNLMAELLRSPYITENFAKPDMVTIPEYKASQSDNYDNKLVALVMHKAAYQLFYKLVIMGEFYDPSTLRINNFLHFWFGSGQVEQLPCVAIKLN